MQRQCTDRKVTIDLNESKNEDNRSHEAKPIVYKRIYKKLKNIKEYLKNNLSYVIVIFSYVLIQIILGIVQYFVYLESNIAIRIARVAGILIDFNSCLIILLVMRRFVTWLRNSYVGRNFLPCDSFITFHKFIGVFIIILAVVHTIPHGVNLCNLFFCYLIY